MSEMINRHVLIDNWIFEVKMVRALRVENYGEPYSAIANINLNGNMAYIDGMLQKNLKSFSNEDIETINKFCKLMSIKDIEYDNSCHPEDNLVNDEALESNTMAKQA